MNEYNREGNKLKMGVTNKAKEEEIYEQSREEN